MGVCVAVNVGVGVDVGVDVAVAVAVGVAVGVDVDVGVGVGFNATTCRFAAVSTVTKFTDSPHRARTVARRSSHLPK